MPLTARDPGLDALAFARRTLLAMLEAIPDDQLCHQPVPGGNHALWIAGHVAQTDDFFLNALAGQPVALAEPYRKLFGMGSTPSADRASYPTIAEIKERLGERREALVSWIKSMDDARLAAALPGDFSTFAPNHAALAGTIAWHEGLHTGQLTMIRKSLGIAPAFG